MMKIEEPFDPQAITVEQLEERIRDTQEEGFQIRQLADHPGWRLLTAFVATVARAQREVKAGKPLATLDDSLAYNYCLGLADGLERAVSLHTNVVEQIDQTIADLRNLLELKEKERAEASNNPTEPGRSDGDANSDLFDTSASDADASSDQFAP